MKVWVTGISHHHCPVEIRERLNLSQEEQFDFLHRIHTAPDIAEALILNTCNRLEFYIYCSNAFDPTAYILSAVSRIRPEALPQWQEHSYVHSGITAVEHLFNVAAGLDSQIIGEGQILSQLKSAYAAAIQCRTTKFMFHKLMHTAFHVGKAVREETRIDCSICSVSVAAVRMAMDMIDFPGATAMVIGAGENAELAGKCLVKNNIGRLLVANRNAKSAASMAERIGKGEVLALTEMAEKLPQCDLVIASTGSTEPILKFEAVRKAAGELSKELLIIDIAVPRDVEDSVGKIKNVRLFNIDDVNGLTSRDVTDHDHELAKASRIIQEHVHEFGKWLDTLNVVPIISELTQRLIQLARAEARRYAGASQVDPDKLEAFAEALAKKIIHGPITFIKNSGQEPTFEQLQAADLINKIFLEQGAGEK